MNLRYMCLAITACTSVPAQHVQVVTDNQVILDGVKAWEALGFRIDTAPSDYEIRVEVVDNLTDDDVGEDEVLGKIDPDTRTIYLNASLSGDRLQHVAAHEAGHILLEAMHLESYIKPAWGYYGIMSWQPTWLLEPTEDDLALACYTIGVCVN